MSLLMQALKKAGHNKPGALPEQDEAALASDPFDQVLALTPDDIIAGRVPPAPTQPVFSLEPMEAEARAGEPAGGVDEQVPALQPAEPAPHDPTPPQARRQAASRHHGLHHEPARATELRLDDALPWGGNADGTPEAAPAARPPLRELALEDLPPDIRPDPPFVPEMSLANDIAPALSTEAAAPLPDFDQAVAAAAQPAPAGGPAQEALDAYASTGAGQEPMLGGARNAAAAAPSAGGGAGKSAAQRGAGSGAPDARARAASGAAAGDITGDTGYGDAAVGVVVGAASGAGSASAGDRGAAAGQAADAAPGATSAGRPSGAGGARGTAARARAAAQAAAEQDQPRHDPARVRLAVLGGVLALVAGTLAGVYWYALTSPGPGASLPPVPMPPPGAGAGPAPVAVIAPPAADAAATAATGQSDPAPVLPDASGLGAPVLPPATAPDTLQPAPGYTGLPQARPPAAARPQGGSRMPSDDELQRALQQQAGASPAAPAPGAMPPGAASAQQPPAAAPPAATAANTPPNTPAPAYTPATPSGAAAPAADIHVVRGAAPQRINAALQDGYQAFMAGDYGTAAQHYASALRQDPNNRDALLGNSAIAARRNDVAAATSGYQRLLELNPNDIDAQAGLLALRPGDPGQSEMRLKDLLRRDPGASPLEFALGNLYAQQGRWTDAQQAYFRAYSSAPDNADYAFNLAVGLDRLSQRKLALTYYQRALDLSRTSPAAFDRNAARRRAEQLAAPAGTQPATAQVQGGKAAPAAPAVPGPSSSAAFVPPMPLMPPLQPAQADSANGRQP